MKVPNSVTPFAAGQQIYFFNEDEMDNRVGVTFYAPFTMKVNI